MEAQSLRNTQLLLHSLLEYRLDDYDDATIFKKMKSLTQSLRLDHQFRFKPYKP